MPYRRLPALNSLRAFEAVGRRGSFKAAADELCVTPAALSQQVRKLEEDLGVELLRRENRKVSMTSLGFTLQTGLSNGFNHLRDAVDTVTAVKSSRRLNIACGPPFAAKWLVPRLGRFISRHPDIDVGVSSSFDFVDFRESEVDASVRLTDKVDQDLSCDWLFEESVLLLATPEFVEKHDLHAPRDLMRVPIIREESLRFSDKAPTWEQWLAAVGLPTNSANRGLNFGRHAEQALDAALSGAGAVLSRKTLATADMAAGRLVSPFGPELPANVRYQFVHHADAESIARITTFKQWLVEEAGVGMEASLPGSNVVAL